ncbi:MAG: hypothetical protein IIX44_02270 [Clostridia bacterium]|nr:hypothetical protein [Clostridia bacterium]
MTREEAITIIKTIVYMACEEDDFPEGADEAIDMAIEALKADTVEVVRCKDCKHKYVSGNGTTQYYVCDFMDAQFEDEGYCHHGERSEE